MPDGWTQAKVDVFEDQFRNFCRYVVINSKEKGQMILGDHFYTAQEMALKCILDALSNDIHWIDILKSRQLGISTITRPLGLFWLGVHPGLKGYSILDTGQHMEEARVELIDMVNNLPPKIGFPKIAKSNRNMLVLSNGSTMNFASGGVKASRGSGTLGRSSGVNFCHVSEMCSIENEEGIEAFLNSLAEDFPDRLYLWESTARGFNQRWKMWEEAKEDDHKAALFIGWWAKDNQRIPRDSAEFAKYGAHPPSPWELKKIKEVKDQYGWEITPEQLAWVRRKADPTLEALEDASKEGDNQLKLQEQPWTEEDAFQMTGSSFFAPEVLTNQITFNVSDKYDRYGLVPGIEFSESRVFKAPNERMTELKVWEEPEEGSIYVVSADPAYGHNEKNDRSAMQVLKCYADGCDQVAEYAWPLITTENFARMIAAVAGWYAGKTSEVYLIVELNGPGEAVWTALQGLKRQIANGYMANEISEAGLRNVFQNVRNFIYSRADSMSPGRSWQWKTNVTLKIRAFERLRDFATNGLLKLRSRSTVEEMKSIVREDDEVRGEASSKDDRVFAMALAVRCWEDRVRQTMIAQRRTRSNEAKRRSMNVADQAAIYHDMMFTNMFAVKAMQRNSARRAAMKATQTWRSNR